MQTYGNPDVTYGWWAGNAGVTNKSGKFIAAHIAHTGLIAFAAGGSTLWELARYNPEIPMGHQSSIFLAHLASIGIGFDEAGAWTGAGVASIARKSNSWFQILVKLRMYSTCLTAPIAGS